MRTRSQSRNPNLPQQEASPVIVEPLRIEYPVQDQPQEIPMSDNDLWHIARGTPRLRGCNRCSGNNANNFVISMGLLILFQNNNSFGHDKETHMSYPIWLKKNPRSIEHGMILFRNLLNKFSLPIKRQNLQNEITRFQQKFDETFYEAWDRFNDLLRGCPHHGFSELHQLDTFYNALNTNDQDSLNSAAGGNFLDKMPRECLKIIESKSKVRQSRSKAGVVIAK
ncbi:reverse transcriptase domain-containing protein [Tanacetum coccineum]